MNVSVIVPFLNEEPYIERCIEALIHQDFPMAEHELLFIDNGSRDRSVEIVKRYPHIILLEERTPGPYAARNKGLRVARGEIIAFTDADCVPARDWLRRICDGRTRTGAAIVLGRRRFPKQEAGVLLMCEEYENAKVDYVLRHGATAHAFAFTNNMAIRADVIRTLGPFAEMIRGGDTEYLHRYLARFPHATAAYLPDMVVTHLELFGLGRWLHKQVSYGWSTRKLERQTAYRPLGYRERLRVFRHCVDAHRYTPWQRVALFGALGLGVLSSKMGWMWAYLEEMKAPRRSTELAP